MTAGRFGAEVYAQRLRTAAGAAGDAGLAGLVVTPGYDLRYLVGSRAQTFERLTALVVPVDGEPTVVVPRLELASLKESAVTELGLAVRDWVDGDDPYRLVADTLGGARRGHLDGSPSRRQSPTRCPHFTFCRWPTCSAPCRCWPPRCCGGCG